MDDSSFGNYCIVCDKLIESPQEPQPPVEPVKPKKKTLGAIRIKNPDGSTTIRTANGVKTTRPGMRRAATEAVKNASPLAAEVTVPEPPSEPAFVSTIYCSAGCAKQDAGNNDPAVHESIARVFGLGITTSSDDVLVPGHIDSMIASPPSPLLGSDTDTSSATSASIAGMTASPASLPKGFGMFRVPPEDSRQRRSSLAYTTRLGFAPIEGVVSSQQMSRQRSNNSNGRPRSSVSGTSSDSLSSLWQSEQEVSMNRTPSNGGGTGIRGMTPISSVAEMPRNRRSSSDGPGSNASHPLPRATMSTTSLVGLARTVLPEAGSAPTNAYLMHSYASAFPARDGSPMLKPVSGLPTPDQRSSSVSNAPLPTMVRMRSRTGSNATLSWDSFGKAEVRERRRAGGSSVDLVGAAGSLSRELSTPDLPLAFSGPLSATPKQSLEDGGWQIRYTRTMARDGARSRSASREPGTAVVPEGEATHATSRARPIPSRPRTPAAPAATPASVSGSGSTARSRTPRSLGTRRMSDIAAIAALRVGSPCAPVVSTEHASPRECRSIPRAGFNWNEATHRTYELPAGVVVNPNKGLFYFKA